jgi:hypothetical protein
LPLPGPGQEFDFLLRSWLSRALEVGMIGSGLGELFLLPLRQLLSEGILKYDDLLLAGMGQPGEFAADDLRFLMNNVTVAVRTLGKDSLATSLIGSHRGELSVDMAGQAYLQGILDGCERCRGMYEGLPEEEQKRVSRTIFCELRVVLVEQDPDRAEEVRGVFEQLGKDSLLKKKMTLHVAEKVGSVGVLALAGRTTSPDTPPPEEQLTLVRIACPRAAPGSSCDATVFKYSAQSQTTSVPVRQQEANRYFVHRLPARMIQARSGQEQEQYGKLWATYLIPEDFQRIMRGSGHLALELDKTTAVYPWEMVALGGHQATQFLGIDFQLTRLFRTEQAPVPTMPPALTRELRVLIIADPYRDRPLPNARQEALAVVEALRHAQELWGDEYTLRATVRIGAGPEEGDLRATLDTARAARPVVDGEVKACDPLEILSLLLIGEYHVVHYAGHGEFNEAAGRMGWVFDQDCVLSAEEIFRVRQVPRLVFANACFSAATSDASQQRQQHVSMAEAFFALGIQNFIGTGWEVQDEAAAVFAGAFYRQVLGIVRKEGQEEAYDKAPPATLGSSLAHARRTILGQGTTWAAYQHYGHANAKLLPFQNKTASPTTTS